jgi:hypothetical protein
MNPVLLCCDVIGAGLQCLLNSLHVCGKAVGNRSYVACDPACGRSLQLCWLLMDEVLDKWYLCADCCRPRCAAFGCLYLMIASIDPSHAADLMSAACILCCL